MGVLSVWLGVCVCGWGGGEGGTSCAATASLFAPFRAPATFSWATLQSRCIVGVEPGGAASSPCRPPCAHIDGCRFIVPHPPYRGGARRLYPSVPFDLKQCQSDTVLPGGYPMTKGVGAPPPPPFPRAGVPRARSRWPHALQGAAFAVSGLCHRARPSLLLLECTGIAIIAHVCRAPVRGCRCTSSTCRTPWVATPACTCACVCERGRKRVGALPPRRGLRRRCSPPPLCWRVARCTRSHGSCGSGSHPMFRVVCFCPAAFLRAPAPAVRSFGCS
jgi:hypothetical protein